MAEATRVQSRLLLQDSRILHAFSTRQGGVSAAPLATLNLGQSVGDDRDRVEENRRRFFGALGIEPARVVRVYQVHGNKVLRVDDQLMRRPGFPHSLIDQRFGHDALISRLANLALTVSTADCVPILIHDPVRGAIAAVHAGWRGTACRAVAAAVAALREAYGTNPADCRAAIGPCIRACCFEVDAPVIEAMASAPVGWEASATATRPEHWQLDLPGINRALLIASGLLPDNIDDLGLCTSCRADLFFSHRRDKGRTGRMMNCILLRDET